MDVTSHPLLTAALHIRDPRKPLPPQTTRRLAADMMSDYEVAPGFMWRLSESWVVRPKEKNSERDRVEGEIPRREQESPHENSSVQERTSSTRQP